MDWLYSYWHAWDLHWCDEMSGSIYRIYELYSAMDAE
jgi:hypothetical protein